MNRDNHIPVKLMDFIRTFGNMDGLLSDNSRVQIGRE